MKKSKKIIINGDIGSFLSKLKNIAMEQGGIQDLALKTGLSRENLYKTLSPKGNPTIKTLTIISKVLGYELVIEAI